jgi:hypothetical protein
MAMHRDSSAVSVNIALTAPAGGASYPGIDGHEGNVMHADLDRDDAAGAGYIGGGTKFQLLDRVVRPARGVMLAHGGQLLHSGAEIEKDAADNRRYVLVAFYDVQPWSRYWRRMFGRLTPCLSLRAFPPSPAVKGPTCPEPDTLWQRYWLVAAQYTHVALRNSSKAEMLVMATLNAGLILLFLFFLKLGSASAEQASAAKKAQ